MVSRGTAALVAALVLAACATDDQPQVDLVAVAPEVGECFRAPAEGDESFVVVGCDAPHEAEVVGRVDLAEYEVPPERPDGLRLDVASDDPPAPEALMLSAIDACGVPFEEYVGTDYLSSRLTLRPLVPTDATWRSGARAVVCVAVTLDASTPSGDGSATLEPTTVTGSVQGSAQ